MSEQFDIARMIEDLDGGTLAGQLSHAVHETAKAVVMHGEPKRKGKVKLEFTILPVKNSQQVVVEHKLTFTQLTARGDVTETRGNETPMHVSAKGVTLIPDNQQDMFRRERAND